jgi:hypothetical protein
MRDSSQSDDFCITPLCFFPLPGKERKGVLEKKSGEQKEAASPWRNQDLGI